MKGLTSKEEEIMNYFWHKGPLFVKELLDFYDEPKPHFNTLSKKKAMCHTKHTVKPINILLL